MNKNRDTQNGSGNKGKISAIRAKNGWDLPSAIRKIGSDPPSIGDGNGSHLMIHGAYTLKRQYFAGTLSKSTRYGRAARALERALARHCGHNDLQDCPVTLQLKIQLAVANRLFLSAYDVKPDSKIGARDALTAENTLNRILSELGLTHPEKKLDLAGYLAAQ